MYCVLYSELGGNVTSFTDALLEYIRICLDSNLEGLEVNSLMVHLNNLAIKL